MLAGHATVNVEPSIGALSVCCERSAVVTAVLLDVLTNSTFCRFNFDFIPHGHAWAEVQHAVLQ